MEDLDSVAATPLPNGALAVQQPGRRAELLDRERSGFPDQDRRPDALRHSNGDGWEYVLHHPVRGKVVLVNFWATWRPPCRLEMPRLKREVWQKFKPEPFAMVAIAREQPGGETAAFEKHARYTFPMASDPKRVTYALFADSGIPRSYVVGQDGKILFQTVGYCEEDFNQTVKVIQRA